MQNNSQIIIYTTEKGETKLEVRLENETVWLTQKLMAELFQTTKQNISLHLQNIFEEGELKENAVVKDFLTGAKKILTCKYVYCIFIKLAAYFFIQKIYLYF